MKRSRLSPENERLEFNPIHFVAEKNARSAIFYANLKDGGTRITNGMCGTYTTEKSQSYVLAF